MRPEERFKPPYQNGRNTDKFVKHTHGYPQEYPQEWEPFYKPIDDEPDTSLWDELWEDEDE